MTRRGSFKPRNHRCFSRATLKHTPNLRNRPHIVKASSTPRPSILSLARLPLASKPALRHQERMLSPRQLHFGHCQVEWKCERGVASQGSVGGLSRRETFGSTTALPTESDGSPTDRWYNIVRQYSELNLSHESDAYRRFQRSRN